MDTRSDAEAAVDPEHVIAKFRGGALLDGIHFTWPLATLTVRPGVVELKVVFAKSQRFKLARVRSISPCLGGVRFEWAEPAPPIIFQTFRSGRVMTELRRAGYRGA